MLKSFFNSAPVQAFIAALLAGWMSFVSATTRWEIHGGEHAETIRHSGEGLVLCVWHGRFLMAIRAWPKGAQARAILISKSREGDVVARVARHHDTQAMRGSSHNKKKSKEKGGLGAFRDMTRWVKNGGCMAITPDGPRGPRMRCAPGATTLARITGAPMLGVAWSTSHAIIFKSWDRFMLPLPFGKGVLSYAEPLYVPRDADEAALEAARLELENRMIAIAVEADTRCRGEAVHPAPPPEQDQPA